MSYYEVRITDEDGNVEIVKIDGDELDTALLYFLRELAAYQKVSLTYVGEGFPDGA